MGDRICLIFTSWPFLVALLMLLINDWWLKFAYPGFITGKVSDFAGLALVGLALLAVWPRQVPKVCLGLAVAFVWWKSQLSEPFIQFVNAYAPVRVGRTVDYGDLVALIALPVSSYIAAHRAKFLLRWPQMRRFMVVPVVGATAFGTMATSVIPTRQDYEIRRTSSADVLRREHVQETIASVAARHHLTCDSYLRPDGGMVCAGRGITMRYTFRSADVVAFAIEAWPGALFFGTSGREKADALQSDLKAELAARFRGLEFVQELKSSSEYR